MLRDEYYDGAMRVPKEIQDVNNGIVFGFTIRQVVWGCAGAVTVAAITLFLKKQFGFSTDTAVVVGVVIASPLFLLGFAKPGGLNAEDWLMLWYSNNIKSEKIRKLYAENVYECVMRQNTRKKEKKKRVKSRYKFLF